MDTQRIGVAKINRGGFNNSNPSKGPCQAILLNEGASEGKELVRQVYKGALRESSTEELYEKAVRSTSAKEFQETSLQRSFTRELYKEVYYTVLYYTIVPGFISVVAVWLPGFPPPVFQIQGHPHPYNFLFKNL